MFNLVDGEVVPATQDDLAAIEARTAQAVIDAQAATEQARATYMHEFRDMRRELLNVLAGIAIAEDMFDEFKIAREALLDIPQVPAVANATTAAEAKAACKTEYMKVVAASPPEFVLAFKELNG